MGLPWWCSGWESACQCRGHGFEPWSGRIPHAVEQLGPWATITEPARVEPVLRNKRGRDSERPAHRNEGWPPLATTRESPHTRNEDPTQQSINQSIKKKISVLEKRWATSGHHGFRWEIHGHLSWCALWVMWWFSLSAFRIFSLSLVFTSLVMMFSLYGLYLGFI